MESTAYRPSWESRALDFDEDTTYSHTYSHAGSYLRERADDSDLPPHDPVPLFLSDPESAPDPREFAPPPRRRGRIITQIVVGVLAAGAVAVGATLFQSDISRLVIVNAKASISSLVADRAAAPASPPAVSQVSLKDPARVPNPLLASAEAKEAATPSAPSREAIASAYQAALQTQPPAAAPPPLMSAPVVAAPAPAKPASAPARTLDADTLAGLMTRARSLMAVGDITSARLLLERAANAQDANAALLLAQTFDPAVLGTQDIRSINADPATARDWYQKAAQLGSAEARQRLTQLQN